LDDEIDASKIAQFGDFIGGVVRAEHSDDNQD